VKLGALTGGDETAAITGFAIDHRKVAPGTVFGAFEGAQVNGEDFIPAAIKAGAIAIVARPQAVVEGAVHIADINPRERFARLAAKFFAPFPETAIAVTGTNGKTSTVEMTRQLWRMAGQHAASIGTLGVTTSDDSVSTGLTTPDVVTFLANVAGLAREGVTHVAFEASSHGLSQYRTEGLPVRAAAFTNLSRDHLDYHGDMAAYRAAKMRLFETLLPRGRTAVLNADSDAYSSFAAASIMSGLGVMCVGERGRDLSLIERRAVPEGQRLTIDARGSIHEVLLPLAGAFQASNALVAAGLCIAAGETPERVLAGLETITGAQGRLERVPGGGRGEVYVDYAHTPDGLETVLKALRPHATGRLIVVFGAGGDRDRAKRPLMGEIAGRLADVAIVTDDNPRSEDPAVIRRAVREGCPIAREIGDRREAIHYAIDILRDGDVVVIAGKGHEQGQIIGGTTHPFDDATVAAEALRLHA
jgi:UDP-N-acetylmuramoyl-L-alanyl-D-glutamate--2,6-diaminopimelate ligase